MGRVSYTEEYSDAQGADKFPKVKLEKGETKRILCPEAPWSEYVHDLRLPDVRDGSLMYEKKKRTDGSEYQVPATKWLSNEICLGDKATIKQQGLDPVNCPACEGSQRNSHVPGPKRRYAMNVVEYATQPNGQIATPFSARYLVWAFTARMFDQLIRIHTDHGGQLQNHDLRIGPPEEPVTFQRYPINALPGVAWQEAGQMGYQYLQALTNAPGAKATEEQLIAHCGTTKSRAQMESDVERCIREWSAAEASGAGAAPSPFAGQQAFASQQAMGQGFGELLQGAQPQFAPGAPAQGFPQPAAAQAAPGANPFGQPQQQFAPPPQAPPGANPFAPSPGPPPHPLESQAAMASAQAQQMAQTPFGQPPQQQQFAPPPQAAPAPGANPFGAPAFGQPPQQQQFAPPPPPQQANPFGQPAQQQQFAPPAQAPPAPGANPFASVAPAPGSGLGEFAMQTTSNPSPEASVQMMQQAAQPQFPPQGQQPGWPPAAQQPGDVSFNSFFPPPGQPGQQ